MLIGIATAFVVLATVPMLTGLYQYVLLGLSMFQTHLERAQVHLPRVSVLIPAWNEGLVIGTTIERLMRLNYPRDRLRVYVVDDASTDDTPRIAIAKAKQYP